MYIPTESERILSEEERVSDDELLFCGGEGNAETKKERVATSSTLSLAEKISQHVNASFAQICKTVPMLGLSRRKTRANTLPKARVCLPMDLIASHWPDLFPNIQQKEERDGHRLKGSKSSLSFRVDHPGCAL
jgi:hypothetical protein